MRKSNLLWGLGFVVVGGLILVGSMGWLGGIGFWTLFFSVLLLIWFVASLAKLEWAGIFFSLAFAAILYDELLGIEAMTPWPVLGAAGFLTAGFYLLFGTIRRRKQLKVFTQNGNGRDEHVENDQYFRCAISMGSAAKYVRCPQLKEACLENSFGNLIVYFDGATLSETGANIYIKNHFGKTTLYVPAAWQTQINVSESFGHVSTVGQGGNNPMQPVYINGDTSFGEVEIHYV